MPINTGAPRVALPRTAARAESLTVRAWRGLTRILPNPLAPIRATAKTAIFFLKVLPMLPSRPVDWVTATPVIEKVRYASRAGEAQGDLYRPPSPGPHPAMLVCLGVVPFEVDHPQVPILGKALARSGFAALLYWSPAMRNFRLDPDDVEDIALAYRWLTDRPDVDPSRSGLLGTCVGGSFALMAAGNPLVRDQVAFVAEWAAYSSMWTFAQDIASATRRTGGSREPWQVDPLTRRVYVHSMTAVLETPEAEMLRAALAERTGSVDIAALSEDGRAIYPLLTAPNAEGAQEALERLPAKLRARLDALSPIRYLKNIRAPLITIAHDLDDAVIPIDESRRMRNALAGRAGVHYTELGVFQHMDPTKKRVSPLVMVRELGKFYLLAYPIFRQAVSRGARPASLAS
jgi:dipeptidyl aminopeptidase/acylaminoacyl peptidase